MAVQYYKDLSTDGRVVVLARIREEADGLHAEYLRDGTWVEDAAVVNFMLDPLYGEAISEREATEIERTWNAGLN